MSLFIVSSSVNLLNATLRLIDLKMKKVDKVRGEDAASLLFANYARRLSSIARGELLEITHSMQSCGTER